MIVFPQPASPTYGFSATYDAWNRQMSVVGISGYAYDGTSRRITKTVGSAVDDYYYSSNWQVLEDRPSVAGETSSSAEQPPAQFIWGSRYIDDLVLREIGSERLYALQDANWNVTAIVDHVGVLQERYRYQAYGTPEFLVPSFDENSAQYGSFDWETLYAGYRFDPELGTYQVRNREFGPLVGTWQTRDPLEYTAGDVNLYRYVAGDPVGRVDADGTDPCAPADYQQCNVSCKAAENEREMFVKVAGCNVNLIPYLGFTLRFVQCDCAYRKRGCTDAVKAQLDAAVSAACKGPGAPRKCTCDMSNAEILKQIDAFTACNSARWEINSRCFFGGDFNHNEKVLDNLRGISKCLDMLKIL
jgi:RHS repeat-associated protein